METKCSFTNNEYTYDANGNQVERVIDDNTYNLSYVHENRLVAVSRTTPEAAPPEPTETPTVTETPTETLTSTPIPSETPEPTLTETPEPSPTATLVFTPTETLEIPPTETAEPTLTWTPELSPPETQETTPTETPAVSLTPTLALTPTETVEPTPTETLEPSPTPTATQEIVPTETETPTPSATFTPTETTEASPTPEAAGMASFSAIAYTYDGNGVMVKSEMDGVTTYYVGGYYELRVDENELETEVLYYHGGTGRFAMRTRTALTNELYWIFTDHLQSSSVILEENGDVYSKTSYTAFGEVRKETGTSPTDYTFTGQRSYMDELGLMYYVARWYDPVLAHFCQADSFVPNPGNSASWDRYAYVFFNPILLSDPTGYIPQIEGDDPLTRGVNKIASGGYDTYASSWLGLLKYNVRIKAGTTDTWKTSELVALHTAVSDVGKRFQEVTGAGSSQEAFINAYDHVTFTKGLAGAGGQCLGGPSNEITFYGFYSTQFRENGMAALMNRNLVVHELGHLLLTENVFNDMGVTGLDSDLWIEEPYRTSLVGLDNSTSAGEHIWVQHRQVDKYDRRREAFADMFIAWTYNRYDLTVNEGARRMTFMNSKIRSYVGY
ncbi:MAG: hypothetical protein HPY85_12840 [Anaerolineae bacterium]|nr:hypothetical protein [Anaerolineae bacterium]